jgi:hypothetical protein
MWAVSMKPLAVRRCWALLAAAALAAACSPEPLAGVGDRASGWIDVAPAATQVTGAPVVIDPSIPIDQVAWYNDRLQAVEGTEAAEVVAAVFARGGGTDSFVQATPQEIAAVLPGLMFPRVVPYSTRYITSQLVIDPATVTLANDFSAAFGLWAAEPYTRSRSAGQDGVLQVAIDADQASAVAAGAGDLSCERFSDRQIRACEVVYLGRDPAWRLGNELGNTLIWYQAPYRYELFVRIGHPEELLGEMASSAAPLNQALG